MIRELEKEVRTLRKELQYFKKRDHLSDRSQDEDVAKDSEDTQVVLDTRIRCEECARGYYKEIELLDKVFGTCNVCENRKRLK